jgi:hypothetical protein
MRIKDSTDQLVLDPQDVNNKIPLKQDGCKGNKKREHWQVFSECPEGSFENGLFYKLPK